MTAPSLEQRVTHLEANVYRQDGRFEAVDAANAHLTDGLNTVSTDLRALTHEVHTEVVPRLDRIDERLDRIDGRLDQLETDVADLKTSVKTLTTGVNALLDHFQITRPS